MDKKVTNLLAKYQHSFQAKIHNTENNDYDILMDIFGITPDLKRENRQYWGRELGMLWQLLVTEICAEHCSDFGPALKIGKDEPVDLRIGKDAIDTKYRIGSGDSGTLKKFKQYGKELTELGYNPVFLILRTDNLPAAITACLAGGWTVLTGDAAFEYLETKTGLDVKKYLSNYKEKFLI